jgi:hypothetical protein
MDLFQRLVVPLVLKIGIHQGQTGRKGVRGGEEVGWSGGLESFSSYRIHHLARLGSSILSACQNQSKDDMLSPLMYLDLFDTPYIFDARLSRCKTDTRQIV